jgi:hypothetical protein
MKRLATVVLLSMCLLVPGYAFSEGKPCCVTPECKCTQEQCMSGKCTCAAGCCKDGKCAMKAGEGKACDCAKQEVK